MRQSWRDLLFLHFACDPAEIAPLLPRGLSPDTFPDAEGVERAWVGLVPFLMKDVRWAFAPPVPGTHTFPETNVRTYVQGEGKEPGVWFFSLDAANALAVRTARLAFALPYFRSRMGIARSEGRVEYLGERPGAAYRIEARLGQALPTPEPGSLEFFLLERYLLYAARGERLWSGRVFHPPYELRSVRVGRLEETLVDAAGVHPQPFVHAAFSERVDVDVYPLRRLR
jgi:uncharacterized protein